MLKPCLFCLAITMMYQSTVYLVFSNTRIEELRTVPTNSKVFLPRFVILQER